MSSAALKMDQFDGGSFADELPVGARLLQGQFTIESFLNTGGFGITYVARDSLNRQVVIKECFPSSFCRRVRTRVAVRSQDRQPDFRSMVDLFVQEARNLSRLDHPNIVRVHQVFQDNDTAYMAMDYVRGPDLLETVEGTAPRLTPGQVTVLLDRMLDALGHVHSKGFLHRDISPDNILLDTGTGEPVLIDFGAARKDETRKSRALSGLRVVKDGYSPQEFYISGSMQGPCSDLYALAATFSHLITGEAPKTSRERLAAIANRQGDPQLPLAGRIAGYPAAFLAAIDKAMSIFPRDRLQSVGDWKAMLDSDAPFVPAMPAAPLAKAVSATPQDKVSAPVAPAPPVPPVTSAAPQPPQRDRLVRAAAIVVLIAGLASLAGEIYDRFLAPPRDAHWQGENALTPVTQGEVAARLAALSPVDTDSRIALAIARVGAVEPGGARMLSSRSGTARFHGIPENVLAPVSAPVSGPGTDDAMLTLSLPHSLSDQGEVSSIAKGLLAASSPVRLSVVPPAQANVAEFADETNLDPAALIPLQPLSAAILSTDRRHLPVDEANKVVATCDVAVQPISVVYSGTSSLTGATLAPRMA